MPIRPPLLLALLVAGCQPTADGDPAPPVALTADMTADATDNNAFTLALYKQVAAAEAGNLVLSPHSVRTALAMTYAGARGRTAAEMRAALHFTLPDDKLHPAIGGTADRLKPAGAKPKYELATANALWPQRGLKLGPAFQAVTATHYGASSREVDYSTSEAREAARRTINQWTEEQTRDKVKELLKPGDLPANTVLVLSNAVYFRGDWKSQFDKNLTRPGAFETTPGTNVQVPMMSRSAAVKTHLDDTWEWFELPYAGDRLTMLVLLPAKRNGLAEAQAKLTAEALKAGVEKLSEQDVPVSLPRFQFKSRALLKPALGSLGMPVAFRETEADFSGMTSGARPYIAQVFHGASVEVDEVGTVAAAATAVVMGTESARRHFHADHPFLFLIRDVAAGTVLFIGRVADPR